MKSDVFISDAHSDTIGEMYRPLNLKESLGQIDIKRMSEYKSYLEVFAVWSETGLSVNALREKFLQNRESFLTQAEECGLEVIYSKKDLLSSKAKCLGILAIEGGEIIGDELGFIDTLYDLGVRALTLTWNNKNLIGSGADSKDDTGLSDFGKKVVKKLSEKKIIIDISHASEKTFYDVADTISGAFMASHSNAKAVLNHQRNLTDDCAEIIIKRGGFIGLNFYPIFLTGKKEAGIEDILRHAEHFLSLGAENSLGLGSDFDGIDFSPSGLNGSQDVIKLYEAFLRLNYKESLVKKIMGENLYEFLAREL